MLKNDHINDLEEFEYISDNELEKLNEELESLKHIQESFNDTIMTQGYNMDKINDNIEDAQNSVDVGTKNCSIARSYNKKIIGKYVALGVLGVLAINIPIVALLGIKIGAATTGVSAAATTLGMVIKR